MTQPRHRSPLRWPRQNGLWHPAVIVMVLSLLAAVTVISLALDRRGETPQATLVLALVACLTALRLAWFSTSYARPEASRANLVFFVLHTALVATLCWIDPIFGMYAWTGFIDATYMRDHRRALVGVAATAVIISACLSTAFLADQSNPISFVALVLANVSIAWVLGILVSNLENETRASKATAARLERDIAEIEALQHQLSVESRDRGRLDERARVARELHDTVAQGLVGIVAQLEAANHDGRWAERGTLAQELARDSLSEARRAIAALGSPLLDEASLVEAVGKAAQRWSTLTGIPVDFTHTGQERWVSVAADFVRVCQEALSNVARHAAAQRVVVELTFSDQEVRLDVGDDGVGFAPHQVIRGHGLTGMEQRASVSGSVLEIFSQPGQGCVLSFAHPLPPLIQSSNHGHVRRVGQR